MAASQPAVIDGKSSTQTSAQITDYASNQGLQITDYKALFSNHSQPNGQSSDFQTMIAKPWLTIASQPLANPICNHWLETDRIASE